MYLPFFDEDSFEGYIKIDHIIQFEIERFVEEYCDDQYIFKIMGYDENHVEGEEGWQFSKRISKESEAEKLLHNLMQYVNKTNVENK